jgi:O-antigen ligase
MATVNDNISNLKSSARRALSKPVTLELTALRMLLIVAATIALPFGSARPWSWSLFTFLIAIAFGIWCLHVRRSGGRAIRLARTLLPPLTLFVIVLLWAFIQILPWTPRSWHADLWAQTASLLGTPYRGRISLDVQSTLDSIMRLAGYAAAFLLAWGLALNREHASRIVKAIFVAITIYAAYGLIVEFSGSETVLWFHKWAYVGFLTGPFVNRNNFATYIGFALVLCEVLLFAKLKPAFESEISRAEVIGRIVKILLGKSWGYLAAGAILMTALLLTASRAGIASTFLGLLIVSVLLVLRSTSRRSIPLMLVLAGGLIIMTLLSFSGNKVLDRTIDTLNSADQITDERPIVFALTLGAIEDHFWTGTGLGTYDPGFLMYSSSSLPLPYNRAHNDYLEAAFELGVPAAIIQVASIGWIAIMCLRGYFIRHRDRNYPLIAVGVTVIATAHSTLDFSLQIPAVAMTFAILLGTGFAQAFSTERSRD